MIKLGEVVKHRPKPPAYGVRIKKPWAIFVEGIVLAYIDLLDLMIVAIYPLI